MNDSNSSLTDFPDPLAIQRFKNLRVPILYNKIHEIRICARKQFSVLGAPEYYLHIPLTRITIYSKRVCRRGYERRKANCLIDSDVARTKEENFSLDPSTSSSTSRQQHSITRPATATMLVFPSIDLLPKTVHF